MKTGNDGFLICELLRRADACLDWISVHKMDLLTSFSRLLLPGGFWGDGQSQNKACNPQESESRIYLTFDDGPSPHTTPWLLEMLAEEKVKASFFLIGKEAERYPELVESIYAAGHSIGNHSYGHFFMPGLSLSKIENEVERTNRIIEEICGERPQFFRPPFGLMCQRTARVLTDRSMHPVYWSQAPEYWAIPGAHRVIRRVLMRLQAGSLIVLHEGPHLKEQTIAAAKEIIYSCKRQELSLEKVNLRA